MFSFSRSAALICGLILVAAAMLFLHAEAATLAPAGAIVAPADASPGVMLFATAKLAKSDGKTFVAELQK